MDQDLDVVVVGNAGVDTNVFHPAGEVDFSVEANFTDNRDYVGQAGGYCSRGYAQLGLRTAFVGHVGDDFAGGFVRRTLAGDGIDLTGLGIDPAGTARSVNLMLAGGGRKNFYDGKGHMTLDVDRRLAAGLFARARLAHCHLPNWARHLLPAARRHGVTVACDLQDMVTTDDPYRRDFIDHADILFVSAGVHADPLAFLRDLVRRHRPKLWLMGLGARGCAVAEGGDLRTYPPVDLPAPVVDTNGAGDGLAVGFLTAHVLEGRTIDEAVLRGQITARHTCAQRASTDHLIRRDELEALAAARTGLD